MHFKISAETINGIVNFAQEHLLGKHCLPIIQALSGLEKIVESVEEVVKHHQEAPKADAAASEKAASEAV